MICGNLFLERNSGIEMQKIRKLFQVSDILYMELQHCGQLHKNTGGINMMERTAQFHTESVESLVERFHANGLETINLGLLCFRFAPALNDMNLVSVLTKIAKMIQTKKVSQVEDSRITNWYFNFYAGFIQYLVNRNIEFELYYSKKGKNWRERLNLAMLCRQLSNYRKVYEKKLRSA